TRYGDLADQIADDRHPQQPSVDDQLTSFRFVPESDADDDRHDDGDDEEEVSAEPVADVDRDLRRRGKRLAHAAVELAEDRDDVDKKDRDDGHGDGDDRRGIDHRAFDLAFELGGFFDEYGDTHEDRVQDAAHLAGRDHVHVKVVEYLRVLLQRLGERDAAFDVLLDGSDDVAEKLVLGLLAQDVEALDDRQAGVDHGGELPCEDHDVLGLHLGTEARQRDLLVHCALLPHPSGDGLDALTAQAAQHDLMVQRLHLALHHLSLSRFSFPNKDRHRLLLLKVFRRRAAATSGHQRKNRAEPAIGVCYAYRFFNRREPLLYFFQRAPAQRAHPELHRLALEVAGGDATENLFFQRLVDHHHLVDRDAAAIPGVVAVIAAFSLEGRKARGDLRRVDADVNQRFRAHLG